MKTNQKQDPSVGTSQRYGCVAMALHWVLALALLGLIGLGWYMAGLPFSPARLKLYNWHKWAGMCVLALSVLRLVWRLTHRPPEFSPAIQAAMPPWQQHAHHATHVLMYLLFFAVPLTGWLYSSAMGFQVVLFSVIPIPDLVSQNKELAALVKPWHMWGAYTLAALIVLHIAGALKHQLIDRDHLMQRMLPGCLCRKSGQS